MSRFRLNVKVISSTILIIILYASIIITGCTDTISQKHNSKYYDQHNNLYNIIEEYISRVGKRLLIVNDNQHNNIKIKFSLNNNNTPLLTIDYDQRSIYTQHNTITISKGLLNYLQDEAELAAILAIALNTINSNDIESMDNSIALNADNKIIQHLYKAGYDPMAFVELQDEYFKENTISGNNKDNWLNFLFSRININQQRIDFNKKTVLNMPHGLQRGKQRYLSNMYLLKE